VVEQQFGQGKHRSLRWNSSKSTRYQVWLMRKRRCRPMKVNPSPSSNRKWCDLLDSKTIAGIDIERDFARQLRVELANAKSRNLLAMGIA
jgi:hypothetical protein